MPGVRSSQSEGLERLLPHAPMRRALALLCAGLLLAAALPPAAAAVAPATASIAGHVRSDVDGAPIEGVHVVVERWPDGASVETWTAGDGSYSISAEWPLDGSKSAQYIVHFDPSLANEASGTFFVDEWFADRRTDLDADFVTLDAADPGTTTVDALLAVGGRVTGHVYDSVVTTPMADAYVEVVDADGYYVASTTADTEGVYAVCVPVGAYKVTASGSDGTHLDGWHGGTSLADATAVAVTAGAETPDVDVTVTDGATISGRVTDHDGAALEGIDVYATLEGESDLGPMSSTDASGAYAVTGLPPGRYAVSFEVDSWATAHPDAEPLVRQLHADAAPDSPTYVTVTGPDETVGIDATLDHGGSVGGYVRDKDGAPISGVDVSVPELSAPVSTDSLGYYVLEHLERRTSHTVSFDPASRNTLTGSSFGATQVVAAVETTTLVPLDVTLEVVEQDAPVTEVVWEPVGWTSGDATFTLSADDGANGSGVAITYYDLGEGAGPQVYTGPVPVTEEGMVFEVWSKDRAGNTESPWPCAVPIDRTAPETIASPVTGFVGLATITLTADDAGAGVAAGDTWYQLDGGPVTSGTVVVTTASGPHTLLFGSVDGAGNREDTQTLVFSVDPGVTPASLSVKVARQLARWVVFRGTISPHDGWSTVTIVVESKSGRRWKRWRTFVTSVVPGSSRYARRVRMPNTATHRVRVYHGDAGHLARWTSNRTFRASAKRR
jgi:protocatechuate 3,4-dioxygenase beta subunit